MGADKSAFFHHGNEQHNVLKYIIFHTTIILQNSTFFIIFNKNKQYAAFPQETSVNNIKKYYQSQINKIINK